jgi:membrane protein implicated in regulation of membrane protease activity
MILMFLFMILPIIAIPAFWLLPLGRAIILYVVSILLSAPMYWILPLNHKMPVATGSEALMNLDAEVISRSAFGLGTIYFVRVRGELWTASCDTSVEIGEMAKIVAVGGNKLTIKRISGEVLQNLPEDATARMFSL